MTGPQHTHTVGRELPAEDPYRTLLQSIVDVARAIFAAKASTIFLLDTTTDELVFEAVSGAGNELVGRRLPSSTGIAGWVLVTGNPLIVEDVMEDPRFARGVGEEVGYVPQGLMAVPLRRDDDDVIGVLEVLDRPRRPEFSLNEIELLSMFAVQGGIALDLMLSARAMRARLDGGDGSATAARLVMLAGALDEAGHEDGRQLLDLLERILLRPAGRGSTG